MRTEIQETKKIILSVNDDATMATDMKEWLDTRGFTIVRTRSTVKALELIHRAKYDAVITNLRRQENGVKNERAGIELASSIRNMGLKTPIVMYTMNVNPTTQKAATAAGVTAVMTSQSDLFAWLSKL